MIDRYGARSVLTASIVVLCISTFALAWSDVSLTVMGVTIPWVFYIAYGTGRVIFASPVQIGTSVVVSRWFIRMRGRTNGILGLSHSAGMVLFPLIASLVIAQSGWRDAWFVLSVVVFVVALLAGGVVDIGAAGGFGGCGRMVMLRMRRMGRWRRTGVKSASVEEPNWTSSDAMRTPALWLLALATGMMFFMHAGSNTHAAAFFQDQGLGAVTAGVSISLNAIFLGISSLVWGRIVERVPARFVMAGVARLRTLNLAIGCRVPVHADGHDRLRGAGLLGVLRSFGFSWRDAGRAASGVRGLFRQESDSLLGLTIRGITEPFTTLGQAVGVMIPGLIFDFVGGASYLPFFFGAGFVGILAMVASLFARLSRFLDDGARALRGNDGRNMNAGVAR